MRGEPLRRWLHSIIGPSAAALFGADFSGETLCAMTREDLERLGFAKEERQALLYARAQRRNKERHRPPIEATAAQGTGEALSAPDAHTASSSSSSQPEVPSPATTPAPALFTAAAAATATSRAPAVAARPAPPDMQLPRPLATALSLALLFDVDEAVAQAAVERARGSARLAAIDLAAGARRDQLEDALEPLPTLRCRDSPGRYCVGPAGPPAACGAEGGGGAFECNICMEEFDKGHCAPTPCQAPVCASCALACVLDDVRAGAQPRCPQHREKLLPCAATTRVLLGLCGLCGSTVSQEHRVGCAHGHVFCAACLAGFVCDAIDHKRWQHLLVACPRAAECGFLLPPATVEFLLLAQVRRCAMAGQSQRAEALSRGLIGYFDALVGAGHATTHPLHRDCPSLTCAGTIRAPDHMLLESALRPGARPRSLDRTSAENSAASAEPPLECAAACPDCAVNWCCVCSGRHHHGAACGDAAAVTSTWHSFLLALDSVGPQYRALLDTHDRLRRAAEADNKTLKRCPHCLRGPIFRIDGCDMMTCGEDAADKDSVARYGGCGKQFDWQEALSVELVANRPAPAVPVSLEVEEQRRHTPPLLCIHCEEEIVGTAFQCIHCPPPGRRTGPFRHSKTPASTCWSCLHRLLTPTESTSGTSKAGPPPGAVEVVPCGFCGFAQSWPGAEECEVCNMPIDQPTAAAPERTGEAARHDAMRAQHQGHAFRLVQPSRGEPAGRLVGTLEENSQTGRLLVRTQRWSHDIDTFTRLGMKADQRLVAGARVSFDVVEHKRTRCPKVTRIVAVEAEDTARSCRGKVQHVTRRNGQLHFLIRDDAGSDISATGCHMRSDPADIRVGARVIFDIVKDPCTREEQAARVLQLRSKCEYQ